MPNQTKYTKEFVLKEIKWLLKTLKDNKDIIYIWELFEDKDYPRQRYNEWISLPTDNKEDRVTRHGDDEEIHRLSSSIKEILETRAVTKALNGKSNPTITIFHLKNNYWWTDKTESDLNVTWSVSLVDLHDKSK